jgi:hypothetical protein
VILLAPYFIGEFNAMVAPPVAPECHQPGALLATFRDDGTLWYTLEMGGPVISNDTGRWGRFKTRYK